MVRIRYEKKVAEAADYINNRIGNIPNFGVILGTGLGGLVKRIDNPEVIKYSEILNFPIPTVEGHEGEMYFGELSGVPVMVLNGRTHYFEVADRPDGILDVVFPVHVMANLGMENLLVTNAAGYLNPDYNDGDIMVIKDHIHGIPADPLPPKYNQFNTLKDKKVEVFTAMDKAYDVGLKTLLLKAHPGERVHEGVYWSVGTTPFQTEAEAKFYGNFADAVGKSTTPEVIVANNRGMKVAALSLITNKAGAHTKHKEVISTTENHEVRERLETTVKNFFQLYSKRRGI